MRIYANMPDKWSLKCSLYVIAGIYEVTPINALNRWEQVTGYKYPIPDDEPLVETVKEKAVETVMKAFAAITGED